MAITPHCVLVAGAGSATLATAVSNFNTAIGLAVTTALAVPNIVANTVTTAGPQLIFDGTLYVGAGAVVYKTQV